MMKPSSIGSSSAEYQEIVEENTEGDTDTLMVQNNTHRQKTSAKMFYDILLKAGPISLIYIANIITFDIKRSLIAEQGADYLNAHIIARTIAELGTLPFPLLLSQTPVVAAHLFARSTSANSNIDSLGTDESAQHNAMKLRIGNLIRQSATLSVSASIPVALALVAARRPLISLFGGTQKASDEAALYLLYYSLQVPFEFLNALGEGVVSAVDQEKWLIPIRVSSALVNLGITFWLVPSEPLKGAAYSMLGKNIFEFICFSALLYGHPLLRQFKTYSGHWGSFSNTKKVLFESWPASLYQLTQSGLSYVTMIFMSHLSSNSLALYQVPNNLFETITALTTAISLSGNRLCAQFYGAGELENIRHSGNMSIYMNTALYSLGSAFILSFHKPLAGLFLSKEEMSENSNVIFYTFILLGFINLFKVLYNNSMNNLSATDDTVFSNFISLFLTIMITIPLSYISVYHTDFDIYGISGAIGLGMLATSALTSGFWLKRSSDIIETDDNVQSSNQTAANLIGRFGFLSCCDNTGCDELEADHRPLLSGARAINRI